ncbi:MAG TPA: alcohol dehydrogenase catalytic domain-containing protein [Gaiellaceae bacterium]|jgi:S-(hydroxymethyl)glutathione dehydrogenase/alcohol dehydrogenase|nr:alcohol dehydrogenase catalytic domain-containing protein [Gaiellaceae bacterium]
MRTRAAVFYEAGRPFEVRDLELDEPRGGEVLVRMAAVGICGTDLHSVKGEWVRPTPTVLGHEGAGVVEAVGEGVSSLAVGDHVVLSWAPSCGECEDCSRGRPARCVVLNRAIAASTLPDGTTGLSMDGERVHRGTATGALAERIVVSERVALPVGDGVPLEQAALLGCAALTGVGAALFAARVEPGSSVLVIGAGGVGQFVVQGARIAGAAEIVCVDPLEARREQASKLGATCVVDPEELKGLMKADFSDGVDYALDAVGDPETTALAFRWTRNGGTCVIVGLPAAGKRLDLDPVDFVRRERVLTGTIYGSEDPAVALPVLLDHVRSGQLDLASQLGPIYPLDEINHAIDAALSGVPGRVLVRP